MQAALGPHPGVPLLVLGSTNSPPVPAGSAPPLPGQGEGSGDAGSLSVPPGDAGSAGHVPLPQAGLVAPRVMGGVAPMLGTGASRVLVRLSRARLQRGAIAGLCQPQPQPRACPPQPQPPGAARLGLGQGQSSPLAHPHPGVPSPARSCRCHPAKSFPAKSRRAQTLPGTWLRCPSSSRHRPPPRDSEHPLASPGGGGTGSHPARPPPSPGCQWPGLRRWLGRGPGSACQQGRRASGAGVPAGAAAAATSTQLTQAAVWERSPKRETTTSSVNCLAAGTGAEPTRGHRG